MIKIYTIKNLITFSSEQIILFGLLDNLNSITIEPHNKNFKGEPRYKNVIETCKNLFIYVDTIEECDIVVSPYKYKGINDVNLKSLVELTFKFNKILYIFFNDDFDKPILPYHKNIKIFRTSFNKSTRLMNEYALPAFSPDYFDNNYLENPNLSIGYCGHKIHGRDKYLNILLNSNLETDFILRNGFWAPGIDKLVARKEYIDNINRNLFTFCYRGAGNFSYRFYDVMMMGRIPILITTDSVYPFEEKYKIADIGLVIDEKELKNKDITKYFFIEIENYYNKNKNNFLKIQKQNRKIWEDFFSPCGFLRNI